MSTDAERRSRLLSLKLRALVRDHLGLDGDAAGSAHVFSPGAAFVTPDATWLLVDGDASRSLGGSLAWAAAHDLPVNILVERDSGVLARRAAFFETPVNVWHVDDRVLLPAVAEPYPSPVSPPDSHRAFVPVIEDAGADAVIEHGVVVGEVRGLEMCRVVDDATSGEARLEVGMGAHDREAFAMVHGDMPTSEALRSVIESVRVHREEGAPAHPFNQFGAERLHRWRALRDPALVGCTVLAPADPPVVRTNVKDAVPCAAVGTGANGATETVVFVNGVDLDVVPFALDAAAYHGSSRAVVALRQRDMVPSMERMARAARLAVEFRVIGS